MRQLFALYFPPTIIINLGYVFAFLFQFVLAHALSVGEVGAFNALFSLVKILMAPASITAFALSRTVARVSANAPGELRVVVERSAIIGLAVALAIVVVGSAAARPLGGLLRVEDAVTVVLALTLLASTLLHLVAVGWLQGVMRYMAAAVMLAGVPTLRFLFGDSVLSALSPSGPRRRLTAGLKHLEQFFILPDATPSANPSWFGFPLTVRNDAPFTRDELVKFLNSKNIATRLLADVSNRSLRTKQLARPPIRQSEPGRKEVTDKWNYQTD